MRRDRAPLKRGTRPRDGASAIALQAETDGFRTKMLRANSLTSAWRLNYIADLYTVPFHLALGHKLGISRPEYVVLFCAMQSKSTTAHEIVSASGRPKNTLSMAIAKLERKGLIVRRRNNHDARRMELRPTAAGAAVYRKILPVLRERERLMLKVLSAAERKQFDALLLKVARRVHEWQAPDLSSLARKRRS